MRCISLFEENASGGFLVAYVTDTSRGGQCTLERKARQSFMCAFLPFVASFSGANVILVWSTCRFGLICAVCMSSDSFLGVSVSVCSKQDSSVFRNSALCA